MQSSRTYEMRVDYTDTDEFAIVAVEAGSPDEAAAVVRKNRPQVASTTLLCVIDTEPQKFLAW